MSMIQKGKVKPTIDSIYDFDQIPEAIERVEAGGLRGKVIINIAGEEAYEGSTGGALYYTR
mgnify:CR=1 FL=1